MKPRRLLGVAAAVILLAAAALVVWSRTRGDDEPEFEEVRGILFGSVTDLEGGGVDAADVVVTVAGTDRDLGTATSDELGLFEITVGDHTGPVIIRATKATDSAATVVALGRRAVTGVNLTLGAPGEGLVEGTVSSADGALDGGGVVEARFVETGRTAVTDLGPDGAFRLEGLPLDGDLILVATMAKGGRQGLAATYVSTSSTTTTAEITLGATIGEGAANEVQDPEIVTEGLDGWSTDGSVTVLPDSELPDSELPD